MDYRAYYHGLISIRDVLWMIVAAPVHGYFRPSDVLADFWHGGIEGAHSSSLCLSRGRSKDHRTIRFFFRSDLGDLGSSRSDESSVSSSKAVHLGVSTIPIRQKLVFVAGVGFVSPMKIWISPIGMTVNRAGSSLAGTQRLSVGTMGKPES
jgi:hypothetical protein